jgi:hypothetical protein
MKKMLFLLLAVLCVAACKEEPDLPDDPHLQLVNPFIGVWKDGEEYRQFRTDGTGGKATAETGPFSDDFSFFVYAGQDVQKAPTEGSLVILDDSGGADIVVTRYIFSIEGNQVFLNTSDEDSLITLERVNGAPAALNLTNTLIGEWTAEWTGEHNIGGNVIWSLKYRTDGTVKTYHHGMHQFENGYALRGNKLVIFGAWRFSIAPVIAEIHNTGSGKRHVKEKQTSPAPVEWNYTKVETAEWK